MTEKEKGAASTTPLQTETLTDTAKIGSFSENTKEISENICLLNTEALNADLQRLVAEAEVKKEAEAVVVGGIRWRTAPQRLDEAMSLPKPIPLYRDWWFTGEVACLFADTNLGKSILATQIANEIAAEHRVLYLDIELSDTQFGCRYADEYGNRADLSPNLRFGDIVYNDDEEAIDPLEAVEASALSLGADVIIIDNLTYLSDDAIDSKEAVHVVSRLRRLRNKYGWSILVLAHTPKRDTTKPISISDLYGSARLAGGFDEVFALNRDSRGQRYVKQVKARMKAEVAGVTLLSIYKEHGFLKFLEVGEADEMSLLKPAKNGTSSDVQQEKNIDRLSRTFEEILGNKELRSAELNKAYCQLRDVTPGAAKKAIKNARDEGVIIQCDNGKYRIG